MPHTLRIELEDQVFEDSEQSPEEFVEELKFLVAAKLYELGKLSSGVAAKLCGKGRVDFLMSLSRLGIPMSNLRAEDLEDDLRTARELASRFQHERPSGH